MNDLIPTCLYIFLQNGGIPFEVEREALKWATWNQPRLGALITFWGLNSKSGQNLKGQNSKLYIFKEKGYITHLCCYWLKRAVALFNFLFDLDQPLGCFPHIIHRDGAQLEGGVSPRGRYHADARSFISHTCVHHRSVRSLWHISGPVWCPGVLNSTCLDFLFDTCLISVTDGSCNLGKPS